MLYLNPINSPFSCPVNNMKKKITELFNSALLLSTNTTLSTALKTCLEERLEYKRKMGKGVDECRGKREN